MLFLNAGRVAEGLRSGTLPEVIKARLLLLSVLLGLLLPRGSLLPDRTVRSLLFAVVYLAVVVGGVWGCYRTNAALDDRNFLERYLCLSIPIGIWVFGLYVVVYYALFFVLRQHPGFDAGSFPRTVGPYFEIFFLAAVLAYFALLRSFIRRSATPPPAS